MTDALDAAVAGAGLVAAFQTVVSLPDERPVGYEALARWPSMNGVTPQDVFGHAGRTGRLDLLDRECICAAAREALHGPSTDGMLLLLNCEPATAHVDPRSEEALAAAAEKFHLVFELTERGLLADPRALLRKVSALRELGFAIALDDIGAHRDSLALLDIVAPDILKLDLGLIQHQADRHQARTVAAVIAHHERTGATILAEGIETDAHLEQALAYGATLGQGYRFGRPAPLTEPALPYPRPTSQAWSAPTSGRSVFQTSTRGIASRVVRKPVLLELSRHIERLALSADSPPIVLATVQQRLNFNAATRALYTGIARRSPLVAVFGRDIPDDPGPGIRGVRLDPDDPVTQEWIVVTIGTDNAAALIARELPTTGDNRDRSFELAVTFDRRRVADTARSLLDRLPSATSLYSTAGAG